MDYVEFAGQGFGQALYEVARDQYNGKLPRALLDRAQQAWNLTPPAWQRVVEVARAKLAA